MQSTVRRILHPAVWTAGKILSAVPPGIAVRMMHRKLWRRTLRALSRYGFNATARRLLLHRLATPLTGTQFDGLILIAGSPRIGKSTVAGAVSNALRMHVLSTDDVELFCRDIPKAERQASQESLLLQICRHSRGLVLEGKELLEILNDKNAPRFLNYPDIRPDGKMHAFLVGCHTSSPESWEEALRARGGWVAERGDSYLAYFAQRQSQRNRRLRDRALAAGMDYFDIPREDWAAAVNRTVEAIVARVRG